jgi:hypothetical protein
MWENLGPIVTLVIFVFNLAIAGVAAWIALIVRNAISEARKDIDAKLDALAGKVDGKIDRSSREFGETVAALREKFRELELYCRDTFVRRDGFYQVKAELSADIKAVTGMIDSTSAKIEARLERMEAKIDSKT